MSRFTQHLLKLPLLLGTGALITLLLFWLMQHLVHTEFTGTRPPPSTRIADITLPDIEIDPIREQPLPPEPLQRIDPPPLKRQTTSIDPYNGTGFTVEKPDITPDTSPSAPLAINNTSAIPLVQVAPTYPQRAQQHGVEGYVVVQFDVDPQGLVVNAHVLYAEPAGYFEAAALRALERYRYQPKVVDGNARPMRGLQQKLTFTLE